MRFCDGASNVLGMLMVLDVGNTQTVVGIYPSDERGFTDGAELADHWRIATNSERTPDELAIFMRQFLSTRSETFDATTINGVAICSGVPRATAHLRRMCERYLGYQPTVLEPGVKTGMPVLYDNPKEVGADRIANAVGAVDRYGSPSIVVDFGTATTFDAISAKGEYLGGAIFPGVEISLEALFQRAAALRRVELVEPRSVIGKSTAESLQSGALYGYASMVDGMCEKIEAELGPCTVISTGGLGALIAQYTKKVTRNDPWVTLHGLRLIYEKNLS
jgi:type III pantothenate kinase